MSGERLNQERLNGETLVLTFPRECAQGAGAFTPWREAGPVIERIATNMLWTPRPEAEVSPDLMQVIPCTTVRDPRGRYHTFLRVRDTRSDLRNRVSLLIGGHVEPSPAEEDLEQLLAATLAREVGEELEARPPDRTARVALVTDPEGPDGARHMAFVHESVFTGPVRPRPGGEFQKTSARAPVNARNMLRLRDGMDPWSRTILDRHILAA